MIHMYLDLYICVTDSDILLDNSVSDITKPVRQTVLHVDYKSSSNLYKGKEPIELSVLKKTPSVTHLIFSIHKVYNNL